jgi:oxygen-independent coproporphyrinogen III oxidase
MAGIYLHIPFCKQKCNYCNFHFSTSLKLKNDVLQAMHSELEMQRNYMDGAPVETVYFGGGTPSLLSADEISRLFETIYKNFPVKDLIECTLEANPDDLSANYIKDLRGTPINRFSIGVQSFKDTDLKYMNRAHNAQEADYAIKAAQDAGFSNLTIDLIYGTPGLSNSDWKYNLSQVKSLQIPHFSAYALTVEEGTVLHNAIAKKKSAPVDSEQSAQQFEILMEQAEAMGYEHYEISNLAIKGHYAIHNSNYWKGKSYLGIGPSAHSFNGKTRRWNIANNALYVTNILKDHKLLYEEEILTDVQRLNEYIMTSLRTIWGCDLQRIEMKFGGEAAKAVLAHSEYHREKDWLTEKEKVLRLTDKGKLFADRIASDLFLPAE